jgi:hypothetical protein
VANTLPKWTGASTLGNSRITDNGTTIVLGGNASVSGNLDMTAGKILNVVTPTLPGDATNKAYVDARVGAMKFEEGTGCTACPYGSYVRNTSVAGWVPRACSFKDEKGVLKSPVDTGAITDPIQNPSRQCQLKSPTGTINYTFGFWTY